MRRPSVQWVIDLGPELELRVGGAGATPYRVKEHLTIGRSAASDIVIDGAGVNLIHARVVPGIGGSHELRCVGMAKITLEDETVVDRVTLKVGGRFRVGGVLVTCERIGDVKSQSSDFKGGEAEGDSKRRDGFGGQECPRSAVPDRQECLPHQNAEGGGGGVNVEMPRLVVCPTCYANVADVPVVARFCPKCGSRLPARDAKGYLIPPDESSPLFAVYKALRDDLSAKLGADDCPQMASSLIILAYANAMLNLGWKYEHGRGMLRNVEEAARCYAKAGRLAGVVGGNSGQSAVGSGQ